MDRRLPRAVRPGLGLLARRGVRPAARDGHRPAGQRGRRRGRRRSRPGIRSSGDARRLYARQMEVYAAFLTQTDHHIGRVIGTSTAWASSTTPSSWSPPTTAPRPRAASTARSTSASIPTASRRASRTTCGTSTMGQHPFVRELRLGLGLGRQHAAAALEALPAPGRDERPADRALAARDLGRAARCAQYAQRRHRADPAGYPRHRGAGGAERHPQRPLEA